ncbi:MAG TPA: hypothetical protein VHQ24_01195 [Lachnospiraceae bacterium]|nr:hypothetical protein [Lachnospiraceae bacterium]
MHALHEASNLPGSYLPQLYLARNYLKRKDFDTALEIYSKIMEGYSHKDEVLFMASGDMGQAGLVKEMIDLVSPFYDASRNNERIGFNLLQGYLVIKNIQDGNKLISRMMQLDRPDLKQYLLSISDEFEKMEDCSYRNDIKGTPQFEMCSLNKPVWHYGLGEVEYLNIPSKENTTMKIGILVYTSSGDVKGMETRTERETNLGRLTRSIPLFISELLYYYTDCKTITFVPIIREVGPVLSGSEWHDDMLMQMARSNGLMWIVTGNVAMDHDELCIMTKLINVLDNTTENIKDSMHLKNMGNPIKNHVSKIFKSITQMQIADRSSDLYGIPNAENLMEYLNSLGQSLTQTLVVNGIVPFKNMYGERNIINDYIMCCKHMQSIQQMPVIMVSGFAKSKEYGSTVYAEFKDQAIKVIRDYEERMGINEEIVEMVKNL